jgi:myo-inositol-1(or 4)-monophosphatase
VRKKILSLENAEKVVVEAIREAGSITMKYFRKKKRVEWKEAKELVTSVDLESEKLIIDRLKKAFPDYSFISEEMGAEEGKEDYTWIIDPVDGTHNYAFGQPYFGISIALAHAGEIVLGIINLPAYNEIYHAKKGGGAYCNNTPDPQLHKREDTFDNLIKLYPQTFTMRIIGCAVIDAASVSVGRGEARIWHNTKLVDVAAGQLLVQEAGGKATNFKGEPLTLKTTEVLLSNGKIHDQLINILKPS